MEDNQEKLHALLARQLKRANINEEDINPVKKKSWDEFLSRISRAYSDFEQDRYLLERSMEISSHEMIELNDKLEFAQQIAHLGYWLYDKKQDKLTWSNEAFYLTGIDLAEGEPTLKEVIELIHEEDREKFTSLIEAALTDGKDYEFEYQFYNKKENKYYWHYAKGHPHADLNPGSLQQIQYLSIVVMDITERKKAEENINTIHQQLLTVSRQAGMAEVATSILHNIGNILNSANVSITLILDLISKSRMNKLLSLSQLIKDHIDSNDDYFTKDQNGKLVPNYLIALSKAISDEFNCVTTEINRVNTHLEHIKEIVSMQKDISGIAGIKEKIYLPELLDLAIQMGCYSAEMNNIEIIKNYSYNKPIMIEKAKLLQILVNIFRNARDSVISYQSTNQKRITVLLRQLPDKPSVEISVEDTGVGISPENLTKIFSLGFTTKPNGHGFGLHSSAIAATELDGSLKAESKGMGKGATFIIELPLSIEQPKLIKQSLVSQDHPS